MRTSAKQHSIFLAAALLAASVGIAADYAVDRRSAPHSKQKVVYHLNSDSQSHHSSALQNIQNHINAIGEQNLDLRVVVHGPGVSLLRYADIDAVLQDKLSSLKKQGIRFYVCQNTLKSEKINYAQDLFEVATENIVPSGVAEIARLQAQGYSYVKP